GPALLVLGHADVALDRRRAAAVDLAQLGIAQRARDLAHPVRTEVEGDHAVAGADARLGADRRGLDELVGLVAVVGGDHRRTAAVGVMLGATLTEEVVRLLDAIPAAVAVHREVAADDRADARAPAVAGRVGKPVLDGREIAGAGLRQRVA